MQGLSPALTGGGGGPPGAQTSCRSAQRGLERRVLDGYRSPHSARVEPETGRSRGLAQAWLLQILTPQVEDTLPREARNWTQNCSDVIGTSKLGTQGVKLL